MDKGRPFSGTSTTSLLLAADAPSTMRLTLMRAAMPSKRL